MKQKFQGSGNTVNRESFQHQREVVSHEDVTSKQVRVASPIYANASGFPIEFCFMGKFQGAFRGNNKKSIS